MRIDQPDIAFFDCDHTLIDTDCELTWKNMLADLGMVPEEHRAKQQHYVDLHAAGQTPEKEHLEFILREFIGQTPDRMESLARDNFQKYISDKIYPHARMEIEMWKDRGIPVVMLSGSTRVMVTPIAAALGLSDVACTELELEDGTYTGRIVGLFCIRDGKLKRGLQYCRDRGIDFRRAVYYGDSISDIQIFEKVGQAVAVNPNEKLKALARENNWRVVKWERRKDL